MKVRTTSCLIAFITVPAGFCILLTIGLGPVGRTMDGSVWGPSNEEEFFLNVMLFWSSNKFIIFIIVIQDSSADDLLLTEI